MIVAFAVCLCLAFLSFGILAGLARALRDGAPPADEGSAPAFESRLPTSARLVGLEAVEDALILKPSSPPPISDDQHWRFVAAAYRCDERFAARGDAAACLVSVSPAPFASLADRPAVRAM